MTTNRAAAKTGRKTLVSRWISALREWWYWRWWNTDRQMADLFSRMPQTAEEWERERELDWKFELAGDRLYVEKCRDCGHLMEAGYRSNEWQCPECGLLWDARTNKPLAFDPTDTGQYAFYSQEGRDVEY